MHFDLRFVSLLIRCAFDLLWFVFVCLFVCFCLLRLHFDLHFTCIAFAVCDCLFFVVCFWFRIPFDLVLMCCFYFVVSIAFCDLFVFFVFLLSTESFFRCIFFCCLSVNSKTFFDLVEVD